MHLPLRRIFDEKRRLMIPLLAGIALNIVLLAGVVYPLGARVRSTEARAYAAEQQLRAAALDDADARGVTEARDRTDTALKAFYKDVLPSSPAQARQATFLRLTQLAEQHNLEQSRRSTDEDIRRFIHQVESGGDFIVIDSISLQQGAEAGAPLTLALSLSTYYRVSADGR
jgi:hypothetical protein